MPQTFNHKGKYICECGKEFNNSQAFNGHKSGCKFLLEKNGKLEEYRINRSNISKKSANTRHEKVLLKQEQKKKTREDFIENWISEQHECERCGKVMTEYYGSGRFCSRSCANGKPHTEEQKRNISKGVKAFNEKLNANIELKEEFYKNRYYSHNIKINKQLVRDNYEKNPNRCVICNSILPFEKRKRKTCSNVCLSERLRSSLQSRDFNRIDILTTFKYGTYKGITCDSAWELAFVIYCLDHNIHIERNTEGFEYTFNGEVHKYFPDFKIGNTYYEIKGYYSDQVKAKLRDFNRPLIVIDKSNVNKYIDYCISTYGENYVEMYDKDKPNWMNK